MVTQTKYKIEGMTCDHCVHHVTQALETVEGVSSAKVSLKKEEAVVKAEEGVSVETLKAAVAEAGYSLVG
ncbi:MAG: cation transporter [Streptococcaceae bacterium]|jgi:copper chaperone|nr:cation transporter [Streptococcaceae bacterium]